MDGNKNFRNTLNGINNEIDASTIVFGSDEYQPNAFLKTDSSKKVVTQSKITNTDVNDNTFTIAKTNGLQSAIDAKQNTIQDGDLTIAKTNGLQTAIDAKQNTIQDGDLTIAMTNGLQSAIDSRQNTIQDGDLTIAMTNGLQTAIDSINTTLTNDVVKKTGDQSISGTKTFTSNLINFPTTDSESKIRLSGYSTIRLIGVESGLRFGRLGGTGNSGATAMVHTMETSENSGFLWRHTNHTSTQGSMSLSNRGSLTVAEGIRVGYSTTDTTFNDSYDLDVNGVCKLGDLSNIAQDSNKSLLILGYRSSSNFNRLLSIKTPPSLSDHNSPFTFDTGNAVDFVIDGVSRLKINHDGNIGVSQTSPTESLDVVGRIKTTEGITIDSDQAQINVENGNNFLDISISTSSNFPDYTFRIRTTTSVLQSNLQIEGNHSVRDRPLITQVHMFLQNQLNPVNEGGFFIHAPSYDANTNNFVRGMKSVVRMKPYAISMATDFDGELATDFTFEIRKYNNAIGSTENINFSTTNTLVVASATINDIQEADSKLELFSTPFDSNGYVDHNESFGLRCSDISPNGYDGEVMIKTFWYQV